MALSASALVLQAVDFQDLRDPSRQQMQQMPLLPLNREILAGRDIASPRRSAIPSTAGGNCGKQAGFTSDPQIHDLVL
jgi:hypothetical protein